MNNATLMLTIRRHTRLAVGPLVIGLCLIVSGRVTAAEPTLKVRITGLFSQDRTTDLRALIKEWPGCTISSVDFDHAEVELRFDPAKLFPQAKPEQLLARLDDKLRSNSNHTFGVRPLCTTPRDKLKRVEIAVVGLDCKACCLAVYEIVARIDGVEQATASFKDGRVTALIDPQKTEKKRLEEALKQRGVTLKQP